MAALARACREVDFPARIQVVVSPREAVPAVETARSLGLSIAVAPPGEDYGSRLVEALEGCRWVCLAGFMQLLPSEVLAAFPNRVLNIHPALLPKFGGKGMFGTHIHKAVIEAGESESGCSIHLVNERYDEGPLLLQMKCAVEPGDTPETLATRVLELEHVAFPLALKEAILAERK